MKVDIISLDLTRRFPMPFNQFQQPMSIFYSVHPECSSFSFVEPVVKEHTNPKIRT